LLQQVRVFHEVVDFQAKVEHFLHLSLASHALFSHLCHEVPYLPSEDQLQHLPIKLSVKLRLVFSGENRFLSFRIHLDYCKTPQVYQSYQREGNLVSLPQVWFAIGRSSMLKHHFSLQVL